MVFQSVRYLLGTTFLGCTLLAASPSLAQTVLVPITGGQFSTGVGAGDTVGGETVVTGATALTPYGTMNITNLSPADNKESTFGLGNINPLRGAEDVTIEIIDYSATGTFFKTNGNSFTVKDALTSFNGRFTSGVLITAFDTFNVAGNGNITSGQIELPQDIVSDISNNSTNNPTYLPGTNNNSTNTPTNIPNTNNNSNGENQDGRLNLKLDYNLSVRPQTPPTYRHIFVASIDQGMPNLLGFSLGDDNQTISDSQSGDVIVAQAQVLYYIEMLGGYIPAATAVALGLAETPKALFGLDSIKGLLTDKQIQDKLVETINEVKSKGENNITSADNQKLRSLYFLWEFGVNGWSAVSDGADSAAGKVLIQRLDAQASISQQSIPNFWYIV